MRLSREYKTIRLAAGSRSQQGPQMGPSSLRQNIRNESTDPSGQPEGGPQVGPSSLRQNIRNEANDPGPFGKSDEGPNFNQEAVEIAGSLGLYVEDHRGDGRAFKVYDEEDNLLGTVGYNWTEDAWFVDGEWDPELRDALSRFA